MRKPYSLPIRKLHRPLKWVWLAFVLVVVTTLVGRWLSGGLFEGKGFTLQPEVWGYLYTYGPWVLVVLLVLAVLTVLAWRDDRFDKARGRFDLIKPANELRPE